MPDKFHRIVLSCFFALVLVGCARSMPGSPQPIFAFEKQAPFAIDVDTVLFQNKYVQPMVAPHIEQDMPVSLSRAVARWVSKRLEASGQTGGVLTVTVNEASVVKSELPMSKGIEGWFTIDQSEKYTGTLGVTFEAVDAPFGNISGQVQATHSITVPEDASIHERELAWAKLEEGLLADFDKAAWRLLTEKMPGAIIY